MATGVEFKGGKDLEAALLQLTNAVAKKIARAELRKAARPVLLVARTKVPVEQGRLKKAIKLKVDQRYDRRSKSRLPVMEAKVFVSGDGGYRARKTARRSRIRGKLQAARYTYQIGSRPDVYGKFREFGIGGPVQPFMRPAWDSEGGKTAINRLGAGLGPAIEREAAKARRGR